MKPVVTWVVLANARNIKVLAHLGPGKEIAALKGKCWQSEDTTKPRDKPGVGHSIAGPGVSAVDGGDAQLQNEMRFAKTVSHHLEKAFLAKEFDRLIIVSGPHMLGVLRASLSDRLQSVLLGEVAKDLSMQPVSAVANHLGDIIAV